MAYSKLRGARKPKKKDENALNIAEHDAFQEQGMKIVDKILAHPYFILGTVFSIILLVVILTFISSTLKSNSDKLAFQYASAVAVFESETGESTEYKDDNEKNLKAIELFNKVISDQEGSFNAAASMLYIGKAYQSANDCDKALTYYKKAVESKKLNEELLFGLYEGEAFCYFDKNDFEKAVEIWKNWLNRKAEIYKDYALYYAGISYEKMGKKNEAVEYYKRLKDEYPKSVLLAKVTDKIPSEEKNTAEAVKN